MEVLTEAQETDTVTGSNSIQFEFYTVHFLDSLVENKVT